MSELKEMLEDTEAKIKKLEARLEDNPLDGKTMNDLEYYKQEYIFILDAWQEEQLLSIE